MTKHQQKYCGWCATELGAISYHRDNRAFCDEGCAESFAVTPVHTERINKNMTFKPELFRSEVFRPFRAE